MYVLCSVIATYPINMMGPKICNAAVPPPFLCSFNPTSRTSYRGFSRKRKEIAFHFKFSDLDDRIYPIELEIKDTTDTAKSASYHEVHFEIDSEWQLRTKFTKKEIISIFTL